MTRSGFVNHPIGFLAWPGPGKKKLACRVFFWLFIVNILEFSWVNHAAGRGE